MKILGIVLLVLCFAMPVFAEPTVEIQQWDGGAWVECDILTVRKVFEKGEGHSTRHESYVNWLHEALTTDIRYAVEVTWAYKEDLGGRTKRYEFRNLPELQLFLMLLHGRMWSGPMFR